MAVFRTQKSTKTAPAVIELPGKIYIEGQAHDATTLAPIFNDTWPSHSGNIYQSTPGSGLASNMAISMSGRHWYADTATGQRNVLLPYDYSLMTCGKNIGAFISSLTLTQNTFVIPPESGVISTARNAAGNVMRIYDATAGTFKLDGAPISTYNSEQHGLVIQEKDASTIVSFGVSNSINTGYAILTNNPATGAMSTISNGPGGGSVLAVVEETATDFWFFHQPIAGTGAASVYQLMSLSKASTALSVKSPTRTTTNTSTGPGYWPGAAVQTTGTNRIVYTADSTNSSTGNLFNFATVTYDSGNPGTAPVWTNVTPSGAGAQPGISNVLSTMQYRTWTFLNGNDIYICVAGFDSGNNGVSTNSAYYIHVYKATKAAPTTIVYVSSTYLGNTARPRAIIPVDENFQNVIVPTPSGTAFVTWNLGTQSYSISSEASYIAASISVDQTGRIWIIEPNNTSYTGANPIHILSPTVSSTISVNFQNASLTYAGSVINTNLLVSAYSFQGSRVANNITLQIDSNSATFADDTQTKTVTTLSNGDLSVPIKITGAGYVRVLANLAI